MQLILIRHAPAGDSLAWTASGRLDEERPLTAEGCEKMRRAARGLARVLEAPSRLFSSPLLRARQTADILLAHYPKLKLEIAPHLEPEADPTATLTWLATLPHDGRIALVGHEPHLSRLLALLVHGNPALETLPFRKGGVAILDLESIAPAQGRLVALLPPRILRTLA